jgi:hypothetical protein
VLNRLEAYAARRGLHDNGVACTQPGALDGCMRRTPRDCQHARLLEGQRRGRADKKRRSHNRDAREWRVAETESGVHCWHLADNARRIEARRAWIARVLTEHVQHVTGRAAGAHAQEHLLFAYRS